MTHWHQHLIDEYPKERKYLIFCKGKRTNICKVTGKPVASPFTSRWNRARYIYIYRIFKYELKLHTSMDESVKSMLFLKKRNILSTLATKINESHITWTRIISIAQKRINKKSNFNISKKEKKFHIAFTNSNE